MPSTTTYAEVSDGVTMRSVVRDAVFTISGNVAASSEYKTRIQTDVANPRRLMAENSPR